MATKKTPTKEIYRIPGRHQLQAFIQSHSNLLNLSELERLCGFSSGTLRHIRSGTRDLEQFQYEKMREILLPKFCELVLLLQLYTDKSIPYHLKY